MLCDTRFFLRHGRAKRAARRPGHPRLWLPRKESKTWMAGSSPAMTVERMRVSSATRACAHKSRRQHKPEPLLVAAEALASLLGRGEMEKPLARDASVKRERSRLRVTISKAGRARPLEGRRARAIGDAIIHRTG